VEFVGCGWGGDWFGEFGWVDGDGAVQAFAGYVAGVEEAAGEVGDGDVFDFDVLHVREEDAFGAGAGDAGEREAVEGFVRVDAGSVDEDGDVVDLDVGEAEFFDVGIPSSPGDGVFAHEAGVEYVEAKEAADVAGDFEVVAGDVFDEGAAAGAGFDVDGEGLC
jgi:hypothetical protein